MGWVLLERNAWAGTWPSLRQMTWPGVGGTTWKLSLEPGQRAKRPLGTFPGRNQPTPESAALTYICFLASQCCEACCTQGRPGPLLWKAKSLQHRDLVSSRCRSSRLVKGQRAVSGGSSPRMNGMNVSNEWKIIFNMGYSTPRTKYT